MRSRFSHPTSDHISHRVCTHQISPASYRTNWPNAGILAHKATPYCHSSIAELATARVSGRWWRGPTAIPDTPRYSCKENSRVYFFDSLWRRFLCFSLRARGWTIPFHMKMTIYLSVAIYLVYPRPLANQRLADSLCLLIAAVAIGDTQTAMR